MRSSAITLRQDAAIEAERPATIMMFSARPGAPHVRIGPPTPKRRGEPIIQISSIGGRFSTPGLGAYQTAKWAIEGFSEVLSKEVSSLGVKVTIIEPGGLRTGL